MLMRAAGGAPSFLLVWRSTHLERWLKNESWACSYYYLYILHSMTLTLKHKEMAQEEGLKPVISYSYPHARTISQVHHSSSSSCHLHCLVQYCSSHVRRIGLWPVSQLVYSLEVRAAFEMLGDSFKYVHFGKYIKSRLPTSWFMFCL